MLRARVRVDRDYQIGAIDPRLYGGFIEHLGRAIYGGIYDPGHPTADADGFRGDVLQLVRDLDVSVIRYPGGNFVCSYNWDDGVGPVEQRPARLDLAWRSTEPNLIGTNEFARWCRLAGSDLMLALNFGTRGVEAAVDLLEYCNHPGGTRLSDLRIAHGVPEPHDVRLWCLGNEMDGPWQIGQQTAVEYGRLAAETGKAMKRFDDTLELVACGSSNAAMATYPDWELTVLDHAWDVTDYISLHSYYTLDGDDLGSFLAQSLAMEAQIRTVAAACDLVQARKRSNKRIDLSFDEWNVWYHKRPEDHDTIRNQAWPVAPPLLEEAYTLADALVVGTLLNALIRNADRVRIACLAQLVNVIAPIMTETGGRSWKQTIYHPFQLASRFGRGIALDPRVEGPSYASRQFDVAPVVDCAATFDAEHDSLSFFLVNRSHEEPVRIDLAAGGFGDLRPVEHLALTGDDPHACNTADAPDAVAPRRMPLEASDRSGWTALLPPLSWNLLRLQG